MSSICADQPGLLKSFCRSIQSSSSTVSPPVSQAVVESRRRAEPVYRRWNARTVRPCGDAANGITPSNRSAARIAVNVDELNQFLGKDIPEPSRNGIGIHGGEVNGGNIGSHDHTVFTAIADAVNVALHLQDIVGGASQWPFIRRKKPGYCRVSPGISQLQQSERGNPHHLFT
jgi:hypothetical protein